MHCLHVLHSIVVMATILTVERSTPIGQIIDRYLRQHTELDDHSVHLLFSANRWEFLLVYYILV